MSMDYCAYCDRYINWDNEPEHKNENGKCIDVDNGWKHYDGRYAVDEIPEHIIRGTEAEGGDLIVEEHCLVCKTHIKTGNNGVGELDSEGEPRLWFCSWDCVEKHEGK